MPRIEQFVLPGFFAFPQIEKNPKPRQPLPHQYGELTKEEIFFHPFDLHLRGRLNKWLEQTQKQHNFHLSDVLSNNSLRILHLYFYPQELPPYEAFRI